MQINTIPNGCQSIYTVKAPPIIKEDSKIVNIARPDKLGQGLLQAWSKRAGPFEGVYNTSILRCFLKLVKSWSVVKMCNFSKWATAQIRKSVPEP